MIAVRWEPTISWFNTGNTTQSSHLLILSSQRRPFDLGDRISISNPNDNSGDNDPGFDDMWLVEDCNLFTTTLRLARSNEISYLNNGMLSNCKIVNHGRSLNATVNILVPMRLDATHEQIQLVKSALVSQRTKRVWFSFWCVLLTNFSRIGSIHPWQSQSMVIYGFLEDRQCWS